MTSDWVEWIENHSASWMSGDLASGFWGMVFAQVGSNLQEQWVLSCRHHLLDDPESPDDILPIIAKDRRLDRYYLETAAQHRLRLIDAWEIYALAGSERVINEQIRAAGFGPTAFAPAWGDPGFVWGSGGITWGNFGTYIQFRPWENGPRGEPAPYWSQFWIVFKSGFHPVTGPPTPWGDFVWGDIGEWVWRPAGYSHDFARTIRAIVQKWKHSRWICRGFVFKIGQELPWGNAGVEWGEAGLMWGAGITVPLPIT